MWAYFGELLLWKHLRKQYWFTPVSSVCFKNMCRMEIHGVMSQSGAQMFSLSKECMINLWIFACSSVLNFQNWFENRSGSWAGVKNFSTLIHKYPQVLQSISSKKLKSKIVPMPQLCWTALGTVRTDWLPLEIWKTLSAPWLPCLPLWNRLKCWEWPNSECQIFNAGNSNS